MLNKIIDFIKAMLYFSSVAILFFIFTLWTIINIEIFWRFALILGDYLQKRVWIPFLEG